MGPRGIQKRCKWRNDGVDANAPPKVLRKDHADSRPTQSTIGGKSLASMGLETRSTFLVPTPHETPADVSDPDPLSFANPQSIPKQDVVQSSNGFAIAGDPESENTSFTSMVGSPESIYQPEWGVTNGCRLDTPKTFQDLVDHLAPPGIQARENEIKNEADADMKISAEAKNAKLVKELENLRAQFTDLQVINERLSQQRCAEIDARLDALSIDFEEELYPRILTAIAGRRWVIGHRLRLAVMKCGESTKLRQVFTDVVSVRIAKGMSEGLRYGVEYEKANLYLEAIKVYDPEADTKYVLALQALWDLKYHVVYQLKSLKDASIDVIMASLHLESDSGEDTPQWIHEHHLSSSQLKVPVYLEVVCRTHEVGSAHHARSDGVPVLVPTIALQCLAILLADAATQTKTFENEASSRLLRSKSLPAMYNLDWP
uniref:Transposase (Putative), gypsy type n=1 Tax=Tanacetum cinerariifolium TaxID=118510 RepID=A0A699K266_TANCI|nr:hypothetical protein [Tanacetum cinerariifolium]